MGRASEKFLRFGGIGPLTAEAVSPVGLGWMVW
jgi:hypothetical protein